MTKSRECILLCSVNRWQYLVFIWFIGIFFTSCDNEKNQDNTIIQPISKSSYNLHVYFIESIYRQISNSFSNEMAIIVHFIMIYVMIDLRLFG